MVSNGRFPPNRRKQSTGPVDLAEISSEKSRKDTLALMIGLMFKKTVGSDELLIETSIQIGDDSERWQLMAATFMNLLYAMSTGNGAQPHKWKELVDHLCGTLNIDTPGDL